MPFRFKKSDFELCTGKKEDAVRLRQRFLELYRSLTELLKQEPQLQNFVVERGKRYNGLNTFSPYIPNYHKRHGGYWDHFWVGFAWNKQGWSDPRTALQYEFGIDDNGSPFYGLWLEGKTNTRATERSIYDVLVKENPKHILDSLRVLGPKYRLWVNRDNDDYVIIDSKVTDLTCDQIQEFISNLKSKALWFHLGKKLKRNQLISINDVTVDIIQTVYRLLPIYRWFSGLDGRPMVEDEVYEVLKSRDNRKRKNIFTPPKVGEREAYVSQRVGQNALRCYTIEQYSHKCALCDVSEPQLLVASHIMPWSKDLDNRGNPRNVICMCVLHDKLFETGLLTINDDYTIDFSNRFLSLCKASTVMELLRQRTNDTLRLPKNDRPHPKLLSKRLRLK